MMNSYQRNYDKMAPAWYWDDEKPEPEIPYCCFGCRNIHDEPGEEHCYLSVILPLKKQTCRRRENEQ